MKHIPVLAIVGYSNSGKTTLMEKLIAALSAEGLDVCTVKHSHHQPEMDTPGKDSWRHKYAGAKSSLLVGPEQLLMVADIQKPLTPQEMADAYFPHADLVLVEGYASMPCAKIEVVREARSADMRCEPSELLAVVTDIQGLKLDIPVLDINQLEFIIDFILHWVRETDNVGGINGNLA